ncbi:MAG: glycosyltransferase [Salibacteraceae bacterium]
MSQSKRILVAPLDWGLGHATRCIPVVEALLKLGATPVVAADEGPLQVLREAFPTLEYHRLPGYRISYPKSGNMSWHLLWQVPGLLKSIEQEHDTLESWVGHLDLDGVISDNRYGLWSKQVPSVLITHQVFIRAPFLQKQLHKKTAEFLNAFSQVWVPDWPETDNLSGALGHGIPPVEALHFIGPLSRFAGMSTNGSNKASNEIVAVVSGPEPQRSLLEQLLEEQLQALQRPATLVCGRALEDREATATGLLTKVAHLPAAALGQKMAAASIIVGRPGYSTLMDLAALGKTALVIPTPGQTEQEYLGKLHHGKHWHCVAQKALDLESDLKQLSALKPFRKYSDHGALEDRLRTWLAEL